MGYAVSKGAFTTAVCVSGGPQHLDEKRGQARLSQTAEKGEPVPAFREETRGGHTVL